MRALRTGLAVFDADDDFDFLFALLLAKLFDLAAQKLLEGSRREFVHRLAGMFQRLAKRVVNLLDFLRLVRGIAAAYRDGLRCRRPGRRSRIGLALAARLASMARAPRGAEVALDLALFALAHALLKHLLILGEGLRKIAEAKPLARNS